MTRRGLLAAIALLCAAPLAGAEGGAAGDTVARITSPRVESPVFGKVTIEATVEVPRGVHPLKVEFFVDGVLVATALDAPYRTPWDAGEGAEAHTIRARVYTDDGKVTLAEAKTIARLGVERARVLLVEVYATVKTEDGRFVNDLKQESFSVVEGGTPQKISVFTQERKPIQIVLLLDVSASMHRDEKIVRAIDAASAFVESLEPGDRVALVTFSDEVRIVQPFTSDRPSMLEAIAGVEPQRGTALYDAIYAGVSLLGHEEGRRALVLLSDGQDQSFDGMGPGSNRSLEDAIDESLRQQVTAFTIGLGEQLEQDFDFTRRHSALEVLTKLAADTGGRFLKVERPGRLRSAFEKILDEMRFQYTLGYHPVNDHRDGSWRGLSVTVSRPRVVVTARKGYFAPGD
ncbi:MAG TPA: VWA domain-containing protein [Verrucomicrobiae bacterium]|nr:VWA domain-containing protein [Verrucomicrobiae bacterium]